MKARAIRSAGLPVAALVAGILCAGALLQAGPAHAEEARLSTIDLVGRGTVTAAPDMAFVTSGVVSDADTAAEAMKANSAAMTQVVDAIKGAGIEARDIQTSGFSVSPRYAQVKRTNGEEHLKIVGYRVSNGVTVRVRDLSKLGSLLDTMVADGANEISGISFQVSDADKRRDEARKEAMADAIRKAKLYAEAAGVELGRILSINEQWANVRPQPYFTARAEKALSDAAPPVEAGEETLDVQVNVSWELKP
ncbi:SIMPL domain-containing protein [Stappia sp. F7233]|uniref:SIMPL domain-containing protein n=1 Tax=Stappia albiluteola TaxID=2758565 RepID=A0A839AG88_9HYPH|nr:SIMPL domain-containing protein [Stappia albiluteola]MBA5777872.1 SIMPL domain-containing protein [Stappia albiluteola]